MIVFAILVRALNWISKSARENCVRPTYNIARHTSDVKALVNEDTLLRTHCSHDVSWAAQTGKHLLRTQNVSEQNQGKHLCRQQRVRYNVSSFARDFNLTNSETFLECVRNFLRVRNDNSRCCWLSAYRIPMVFVCRFLSLVFVPF